MKPSGKLVGHWGMDCTIGVVWGISGGYQKYSTFKSRKGWNTKEPNGYEKTED